MSCIIDLDLTNAHNDASKPCSCGSCSINDVSSSFVEPKIIMHLPDGILNSSIKLLFTKPDNSTLETTERIIDKANAECSYSMPFELFNSTGIVTLVITAKESGSVVYQSPQIKFNITEELTNKDCLYISLADYTEVPHIFNVSKCLKDNSVTPSDINNLFKDVSFNAITGVLTFTRYDGTTKAIDTPMEEIVSDGYYDEATQKLVLVLVSGQTIKIPVSGLIDDYTGATSSTIQITISSDNVITANLVGGGITKNLLSTSLISEIDNKVEKEEGKGLSSNDFTNDYKSAVEVNTTNRHSHTNKEILDATTASYTTEEKTKLAGLSNYDDTAIQQALSQKANASDIPTELPSPNALTIKQNGEIKGVYNGSSAVEVALEIGGGAGAILYDTYGSNTDGSMTQLATTNFVNDLRSSAVLITESQHITGKKNFLGGVTKVGVDLATVNDISTALAAAKEQWLLDMNPIGTIIENNTGINPSTYIGGTWELYGQGRVTVGIDTSDSDFGGSKGSTGTITATLTISEYGSGFTTLPTSKGQIDYVTISYNNQSYTVTKDQASTPYEFVSGCYVQINTNSVNIDNDNADATFDLTIRHIPVEGQGAGQTGGSKALQQHTHTATFTGTTETGWFQPLTGGANKTYATDGTMFTKGSNYSASGVYNNAAGNAVRANLTITPKGTITVNNAGTGESGNLQPYIVVYRWIRTA